MTPDDFPVVMPSAFVPEDGKWIQAQMRQVTPSLRRKVALRYAEVWQAAFDAEPVSFRQENRARHEANTRLRLFVDRYHSAAMGLTEKPALASGNARPVAAAEVGEDQLAQGWW